MGRGNVCVHGKYEGLYFVDRDYLDVYTSPVDEDGCCEGRLLGELDAGDLMSGWEFDRLSSEANQQEMLDRFMDGLLELAPSFERCGPDLWDGSRRLLLENGLFYIAVENNEWSLAVELVQKEDDYHSLAGLQARHYEGYLSSMLAALLALLPSIGTYTGPWTSGRIKREDMVKNGGKTA